MGCLKLNDYQKPKLSIVKGGKYTESKTRVDKLKNPNRCKSETGVDVVIAGLNHVHSSGKKSPPECEGCTATETLNARRQQVRNYVGEENPGIGISRLTGQSRHVYGPDAIYLSKGVTGGAGAGGTTSGGTLIILRGDHKGFYAMGDYGVGLSTPSISTEVSATALYYSGDVGNISDQTFAGPRTSRIGGVDVGFSLSGSYTTSEYNGVPVYGFGLSAGLGASSVIFDFNYNRGNTVVK